MKKNTLILTALLIALGIAGRLLPHPANFTPVAAIALFGAFYLPKRWAVVLPLLAILLSDIFIGFYNPKMMIAVYGSFAITGAIGLYFREKKSFATVAASTLLGSIIFFLVTNAAVWAFGTMYTKDLAGLLNSYTMAIPFFRNSLLGNVFFVSLLFGSMEMLLSTQKKKASLKT